MSILTLLLLQTMVFASKDPQCKATNSLQIVEEQMNPVGLKSYIDRNRSRLKTIDDIICCLPESYRKNFVFVHSSFSAQSSDVHRPRAILFNSISSKDPRKMGKELNMVLSFNGGGNDLTNSDNIEIMYNNKKSNRLDFYDFDLSQNKLHMSGKNPAQCLQCHGSSLNKATSVVNSARRSTAR